MLSILFLGIHHLLCVGDKVTFVGNRFPVQSNGIFRQLHVTGDRLPRGPAVGSKGRVMITFDEVNRRVGVRFEKPITGGNSLGGLCEESHGFFTDAAELRHDTDGSEGSDTLHIETLFEAAAEAQPCILFLRDAEKCLTQSYDRYATFKRMLDKVTGRVVVIGACLII